MIETQKLLEQDRERILGRLSGADSQEQAVAVLDEELGRLLVKTGEGRNASDPQAGAVRSALQTVRASLPLIDTAGEVRIYERTGTAGKADGAKKWGLILAGAACSAGGVIMLLLLGKLMTNNLSPLAIILVTAGFGLARLSGTAGVKTKRSAAPAQGHGAEREIHIAPDAEKLYHRLSMTLAAVDASLAEQEEAARAEAFGDTGTEESGSLDTGELRFFSELLELIYADQDRESSAELLSSVRYYLHLHGVETEEYDGSNARMFDMMPSSVSGTLRPALVNTEKKLLVRGLAAP